MNLKDENSLQLCPNGKCFGGYSDFCQDCIKQGRHKNFGYLPVPENQERKQTCCENCIAYSVLGGEFCYVGDSCPCHAPQPHEPSGEEGRVYFMECDTRRATAEKILNMIVNLETCNADIQKYIGGNSTTREVASFDAGILCTIEKLAAKIREEYM